MMDYPALAALAAVLREGSFERAAAALGVTPSAVSQRVRGLEERMGTVLVVRSQPPAATETGARLAAHVEQVRLLEGELTAAMPGILAGGEGPPRLRVAVNADSLGTWFPAAAAAFATARACLLDLVIDDEDHTAERLRTGDVLAAVTTSSEPVQGCRLLRLGALRYLAAASPDFAARHFPAGVTAEALAVAPVIRFDRRDHLQAHWARLAFGIEELSAPTHWVPSTHGFLDMALAGLGWCMNPVGLVEGHIAAGRLVALSPAPLAVTLHWQHSRLGGELLHRLTADVVAASRRWLAPAA